MVISSARHLFFGESMMTSRTFDDVDRMFEQMDRMLDGMWSRVSDRDSGISPWGRSDAAYDLHENEDGDGYALVVDVPGFEKDEIEIQATETHLTIEAAHETDDEQSFQRRHISERFSLPADVDLDEITASYHNGVLEIELPVDGEVVSGHRIDIE